VVKPPKRTFEGGEVAFAADMPESSEPSVGPDPKKVTAVNVRWETEPPPVAADFAVVASRTPGQFAIVLCSVSPADPTASKDGELVSRATIVASVRMTAPAFLSLTQLMVQQWNRFAEAIGAESTVVESPPSPAAEGTKNG
jgi:hypothetical protein